MHHPPLFLHKPFLNLKAEDGDNYLPGVEPSLLSKFGTVTSETIKAKVLTISTLDHVLCC